jgi:hypothetical protein
VSKREKNSMLQYLQVYIASIPLMASRSACHSGYFHNVEPLAKDIRRCMTRAPATVEDKVNDSADDMG